MQITIRLLASYRRYLPEGHHSLMGYDRALPNGACVGDVLDQLPIPSTEVFTFLVNGRHARRDQLLKDGDTLAVFPSAGGG